MVESGVSGARSWTQEPDAPTPVVDLMEALRASVAASKQEPAAGKKKAAPRKRSAASK